MDRNAAAAALRRIAASHGGQRFRTNSDRTLLPDEKIRRLTIMSLEARRQVDEVMSQHATTAAGERQARRARWEGPGGADPSAYRRALTEAAALDARALDTYVQVALVAGDHVAARAGAAVAAARYSADPAFAAGLGVPPPAAVTRFAGVDQAWAASLASSLADVQRRGLDLEIDALASEARQPSERFGSYRDNDAGEGNAPTGAGPGVGLPPLAEAGSIDPRYVNPSGQPTGRQLLGCAAELLPKAAGPDDLARVIASVSGVALNSEELTAAAAGAVGAGSIDGVSTPAA